MGRPVVPAAERLRTLTGGGFTDRPELDVVRDGQEIHGECVFPSTIGSIQFSAANIRRERTGVHAKITVQANGHTLAWSVFNVERDEDRTRLSNAAAGRIGSAKQHGAAVKVRLDLFCESLWSTWTDSELGGWIEGTDTTKPRWLLEPFLLQGGGTILFGPPGGGKSWIGLMWALGLQHGTGLPWASETTGTLFVNLEREAGMVRWRIHALGNLMGIENPRLLALNKRGRTLDDSLEPAKRMVDAHQVGLVVVDSLSRSGTGDLTSNDSANRAMDALNSLGCSWCVIAHSPRGDNTHTYGSVMFDAAADMCVRLTSTDSDDETGTLGIALEVTKANDARRARQQQWALDFENDRPTAFRPARENEFVDLAPIRQTTRKLVEDYLRSEGKATPATIAEVLGLDRSRVSHILTSHDTFVKLGMEKTKGRPAPIYGLRSTLEEPIP